MNPATLIPTPDAISAPWGWFYVLLLLTFLLHVLVMNAMLGGGIIALFSALRGDQQNTLLGKEFGYKWPYTIAFAVNMGVAPLLFVQVLYGQFIYSSSILMAVWWFSIFGLVILAYYSAYIYDFKFEALGNPRIFLLEFSVFILLFVAFLFSNNMTLMLQPEKWQAYFSNGGGTLLNLSDPTLYPRYLHFVVGSVAVAGLFLALVGHFRFTKSNVDQNFLIAQGMTYFTYATAMQIFIGFWFLLALPKNVMMIFMGGSVLSTILLLAGIILGFTALYFGYKKRVVLTSAIALVTLIVMVIMRDLVRSAYLQPYFQLSDLTVEPQYSPLIFFLLVFAGGLLLIGYMLKLAFGCRKEVTK
ncbi:hypothetical protein SAMN05660420_00927 [Desulfuromusa kysingii]|uniref:Uncharacterized protein n=1 Tax=Desulfuromusa kysingii TaxID=37625 RepID=A0A1H3XDW2_9BACT|nr:hypothetical protein [Desulfuromusa kysingii]SDZ97410.1 hypothetical protein SAMN05660420_00927 [Desulfuromusa kysingii]